MPLSLSDLQMQVASWQEKNFPVHPSWHPLLGIAEEVGELCHAHLKQEQGIREEENHEEAKKDAIGDILIFLADYCNVEGFDLQEALDSTWADVQVRDWRQDPREEKL